MLAYRIILEAMKKPPADVTARMRQNILNANKSAVSQHMKLRKTEIVPSRLHTEDAALSFALQESAYFDHEEGETTIPGLPLFIFEKEICHESGILQVHPCQKSVVDN